ncbi:hypothetical protein GY45DRAFT_176799 [Cubamyces sp. BRFM 1775]|nr:hypothetical protein GY45DRAFT_176799 [Cubamyces sp. BRFM 1775]
MCEVDTHHTGSFHLLELPHELQLSILKHLDVQSLLACKAVCSPANASPALGFIIDDNLRTLYQLQLEAAGMADGPQGDDSDSPLHERLHAICDFRTAWASGEHPVYEVTLTRSQQSGHSVWHYVPPRMAVEVACIDQQEGSVHIIRPPGLLCGLGGGEYVYGGLKDHINFRSITGFHVDLAQDLFVWCDGITNDPPPSLHFCSLSNGFAPHPKAARPTIFSCFPTYIELFPFLEMQVLGDIVAWSMYGGDTGEQETDLLVINWKTGMVVWHMHFHNDRIYMMLISQTQLCILHCDNMSIYLCTFDPCASANNQPCAFQDSLAVLRLPACHDRVVKKVVYSEIGLPPTYPLGTPHDFHHDPTQSILAITINLEYALDDTEYDSEESLTEMERFLLFIPVGTLFREYHLTHNQYANVPPPAAIEGAESEPDRIIPWEHWGPSGTRMVSVQSNRSDLHSNISAPPSVLGAYASLAAYCPSEDLYVVTIYEIHSLSDSEASPLMANADGAGVELELGQKFRRLHPEDDYIRGTKTWKDDIHTTLPYRTTTRTLPRRDTDGRARYKDQRSILLTHDGLVHINEHW